MADKESDSREARSRTLLDQFRLALGAILSTLQTRLELAVTELEEERERLKHTMLLTLIVFFCAGIGIILLTLFLVAIFWEGGWIYALGALACIYLVAAVIAGVILRKNNLAKPGLLSATLSELGKDRERLGS